MKVRGQTGSSTGNPVVCEIYYSFDTISKLQLSLCL